MERKKTNIYIISISITITFLVMLLTIGWSAFNSSLFLSSNANIRVKKDTRITAFRYVSGYNVTGLVIKEFSVKPYTRS